MDSTTLIHSPNTTNPSKLPIKRKTPDPNPHSDPISASAAAPPFKFHRIWTEPDEIRFLQGLLDCSSQNLAFPRDLAIFYACFSDTMSQPYTKSQLSEKLRRLRKKFRVISARLSKGMDRSQLSLHDRALYDLSRRLWHPEFAATSPFSGARNVGFNHCNNAADVGGGGGREDGDGDAKSIVSSLVGVKVDFSPTLSLARENCGNLDSDCGGSENGYGGGWRVRLGKFCDEGNDDEEEVKLSEVNVEFEGEEAADDDDDDDDDEDEDDDEEDGAGTGNGDSMCGNEIGEVAAKVVINVFDECLKEARRAIGGGSGGGVGAESLYARWQKQRIAELDALGSRLRLVLEHSLTKS